MWRPTNSPLESRKLSGVYYAHSGGRDTGLNYRQIHIECSTHQANLEVQVQSLSAESEEVKTADTLTESLPGNCGMSSLQTVWRPTSSPLESRKLLAFIMRSGGRDTGLNDRQIHIECSTHQANLEVQVQSLSAESEEVKTADTLTESLPGNCGMSAVLSTQWLWESLLICDRN